MGFTLSSASFVSATLLSSAAQAWTPASTVLTDELEVQDLVNLAKYEAQHTPPPTCNTTTGYIRKEWHTLQAAEKTAYINAVFCLQSLPSKSGSFAPGARIRFDDFVAVHINQTLVIHATVSTEISAQQYEQKLTCGTGQLPIMAPLLHLNLRTRPSQRVRLHRLPALPELGQSFRGSLGSPLFEGSATSISNNGGDLPNKNSTYFPSAADPLVVIPPGLGGEFVTAGPFKNMSVNLGPVVPAYSDIPPNPSPDGLGYNARCLRRDLSTYAANLALKDTDIANLIVNRTDIASFQNDMQGLFTFGQPFLGVHTAGHFVVGGDPGGDFFASPGDHLKNRQNAIAGSITILNEPPSRNGTLQDILALGVNAPPITIASAMSTLGGEFCYIYA